MPITLPGTGEKVATRPNSQDEHVQDVSLVRSDSADERVTADGTGLRVALGAPVPAGTNNIGDVDVLSVPSNPFGANADAASASGSISAKLRQIATNGIPVTGVVPGTTASALGKAEDAGHASGDTGVMALAVRTDTAAASSGTTGDYEPLHTDASGNLRTLASINDGSGAAVKFPTVKEYTATPSLGTGACEQYDSLHSTIITLAGVVGANGGVGQVLGANLASKHNSFSGIVRAYLFDTSFTGTTAQAALSISDTDVLNCVGTLEFDFSKSNGAASRIATANRADLPLMFKCDASVDDLFCVLQLWSDDTPTFGSSDLQLRIYVQSEA